MRRTHYFRSRVQYYPNSDACFNVARVALSGDVEPSPGPGPARPPADGSLPSSGVGAAGDGISMVCQNARSIKGKLGSLRALAPTLSTRSILALTETWLDSTVASSELEYGLPSHIWFRRDRPTREGGVACAVDSGLKPVRRMDLERIGTETLIIELRSKPSILLSVCYCPPADASILNETMASLQDLVLQNPTKAVLVTGDFNIPNITWARAELGYALPVMNKTCRRASSFLDMCQLTGHRQHVHQPTRGNNVLDLALSTEGIGVEACVQESMLASDHSEVSCSIHASFPAVHMATRTTALNYKRADWDGLRQSLRLLPWGDLLNSRCVNSNVDQFYSLLEGAISDHIPTVTLRRRHPRWFDRELREVLIGRRQRSGGRRGTLILRRRVTYAKSAACSNLYLARNTVTTCVDW